ncbi:MAG: FCD domain-containing protein [Geothrix sp.]|uniref:FadR/GntR family transcriptional regulator n=1 Tax=Geothrix sp. TaxID=1962974 RepID=UPI00183CA10F|nr:FCD domain-containing protein [Geothrix sp.]NWJ41823.1 FCD domain-containing protein [Geothrix sp.]WIL20201.1 MAG: FCD domain-containing protein [Geothrix sp.]
MAIPSTRVLSSRPGQDGVGEVGLGWHLSGSTWSGPDASTFNELDSAFHGAIARATGNLLAAELTIALREAQRPRLLASLRAVLDLPAVTTRLRADHHGIYEAIRQGQPQAAADRVEAHIVQFYGPVS